MGMTINNSWKLFCYGVKRYQYEKFICIREFSEQLAQYWFINKFSPYRGTPANNKPTLDEVYYRDTVSTWRALYFLVVFRPPQRSALFPKWLSTVPQLYLLDLSIFPKKNLNREVYITGLLEVNFQGSCLMEIDASIEAFGFARYVIGSTRRYTIVNKFAVIFLDHPRS